MQDRKVLLDTETTGFYYDKDDRIIEIAALELVDGFLGEKYHFYINPQRDIPQSSSNVHGITNDKVSNSPLFADIVESFLAFIQNSPIIAHNAEFDRGFLNAELRRLEKEELPKNRFIDTLSLARAKYGAQKNTLDDLCKRFNIEASARKDYHGALIDTVLLAEVYKNLTFEQQNIFNSSKESYAIDLSLYKSSNFPLRKQSLSLEEENEHKNFLNKIKNAIWLVNLEK